VTVVDNYYMYVIVVMNSIFRLTESVNSYINVSRCWKTILNAATDWMDTFM